MKFNKLAAAAAAKSLQLRPTLCNPIDSSPPGSNVPGILQARTMEWVAIFALYLENIFQESELCHIHLFSLSDKKSWKEKEPKLLKSLDY